LSVFDEVKKALEAVIAPDIATIKADLKVLSGRVDMANERLAILDDKLLEEKINTRFDGLLRELATDRRLEKLELERYSEQKKAGAN
jgi:hypothetical protein